MPLGAPRPDREVYERSAGFDGGRGGGGYGSGGPLQGDFRAPTRFDVLGPGSGAPILVLPSFGWNSISTREVVTTLLLIDLLGRSNSYVSAYTPGPSPTSLTAGSSLAASNVLDTAQSLAAASSVSLAAKPIASDIGNGPAAAPLDRGTSTYVGTPNAASLAGVSTAVNATSAAASRLSPSPDSASFNRLPSYIIPDDGAPAAENDGLSNPNAASGSALSDGEGGLVELSPRGAQLPHSRNLKTDDKLAAPSRRFRDLTDDEAFWGDVLDGLDDLLNDSDEDQPVAKPRDAVRAERAAQHRRDQATRQLPSPAAPMARYDEGGLIAIRAGDAPRTASPAIDDIPTMDPVHVTMDAGVALFQAFERSEGPVETATPSSAATNESDRPSGGDLNASAEESPETSGKVAAGVGLGLLAAWPWMRRRKRSREEQS